METESPAPAPEALAADAAASPQLKEILDQINLLAPEARAAFEGAKSLTELEDARVAFLGQKSKLTGISRGMGGLSPAERPIAGKILNVHKAEIIGLHKSRLEALEAAELTSRLTKEGVDITMPGAVPPRGHLHPILRVQREIESIFQAMGFRVTESPEVETEWVNFDALNILSDHPARDMQDTFFTERGRVLRTHTSGNQIRTMIQLEPPLSIISSGKVYRCDSDVTHSPMFFQMEGYMVDKNISMAHLKGVLSEFVHGLFGPRIGTRFRPSFFPFTEPSAEVDIQCIFCTGKGCRVCSDSGWLEIGGSGMIHPQVLRNCNIDPEKWSGFAFGLGLDRVAMLKYGINDIRLLYEGDVRFLSQF